jgi:ABC-type Fe3+-hydroxamate transport system substrate-binding protein
VMLIEIDPSRLPPGFAQKASALGIKLVNVKLQTLADVLDVSRQLGQVLGETKKGDDLAASIDRRIGAVRRATDGKPRVRTLLAMDERGEHLVGVGEFLNDALLAAGGVNVAESLHAPYPSADPETLAKLKPDAVIVLKPGGTEQTLEAAKQFWSTLGGSPPRVFLINDRAVLLPGSRVAHTAEAMAKDLHP